MNVRTADTVQKQMITQGWSAPLLSINKEKKLALEYTIFVKGSVDLNRIVNLEKLEESK